MKYIKGFIIFILVLWVATAPIAVGARPGSLLYRLNVTVNEPVWAWVHITSEGRANTTESHLEKRYLDMEQAFWSNQDWQEEWAVKAEAMTAKRVFGLIASTADNSNYKVADTLASHAQAITRAHRQVLQVLVLQPGLDKSASDVAFLDDRLDRLATFRANVSTRFTAAYDKVELVRGIDGKLLTLEQDLSLAEKDLKDMGTGITESQRVALEATLAYAKSLYSVAQNQLGIDQYVEAYKAANDAQGYALEAEIVMEAIREYNLPISPTPVPVKR